MELKLNHDGAKMSDVFGISEERAEEILVESSKIAKEKQPGSPAEVIEIFLSLINTVEELAFSMFIVGANLGSSMEMVSRD